MYQGQLIGTVELSFASSTRTKSLTLNPPEVGHCFHFQQRLSKVLPSKLAADDQEDLNLISGGGKEL